MSTLQTTILKHPDSGTNNIQFDSSGNVGIGGISSPARKLHVHQASSDGCDLVFTNTTTGDSAGNGFEIGISNSEHAVLWNYENTDITFATNNTERLRINSSGNCGIGNQNPQAKLHLGSTAGTILKLQSSAASTYTNFINTSNALGFIGYEGDSLGFYTNNLKHFQIDTDGTIKFSNSSNERLRVDSSGRLLVGTTAAFGATDSELLQVANSNGGKIGLLRNDGSIASGNEVGVITWYSAAGNTQPVANIACVADGDHAANDKPGRLIFSTTPDGSGSPSQRWEIDNAGALKSITPPPVLQESLHLLGSYRTLKFGSTFKIFYVNAGSGTAVFDTGITVNQGNAGATMLLFANCNTSNGTSTSSAIYAIQFYYDGNNTPTKGLLSTSSSVLDDFVAVGKSASNTLTLQSVLNSNWSFSCLFLQ